MTTQCTFITIVFDKTQDMELRNPCTQPATHYCLRELGDEVWTLETEPRQAFRLNGSPSEYVLEDDHGRPRRDKDGKLMIHRVMHAPEFCLAHAEQVRFMRNVHALVEA